MLSFLLSYPLHCICDPPSYWEGPDPQIGGYSSKHTEPVYLNICKINDSLPKKKTLNQLKIMVFSMKKNSPSKLFIKSYRVKEFNSRGGSVQNIKYSLLKDQKLSGRKEDYLFTFPFEKLLRGLVDFTVSLSLTVSRPDCYRSTVQLL